MYCHILVIFITIYKHSSYIHLFLDKSKKNLLDKETTGSFSIKHMKFLIEYRFELEAKGQEELVPSGES